MQNTKKSKSKRLADIVRFSCSQSLRRDTRQNATRQTRRDKNYLTIMNDEYFKEIGFKHQESVINGLESDDKDKTTSTLDWKNPSHEGGEPDGTAHHTGKNQSNLLLILLVSLFLLVSCLSCGTQKLSNTEEFYETYQDDEIKYHKNLLNLLKMKIKDYLHSDLLRKGKNDLVFQKTYATIDKLAQKITKEEIRQSGLKPHEIPDIVDDLRKHNLEIVANKIVKLINYTIHNFEK